MTENLRLKFAAGDVLTPADTNVSKNTTVTLATQPANQPSDNYYGWGGVDVTWDSKNDRWLSRDSGAYESNLRDGNLTGENQYIGTFYNFYTATAGTVTAETQINSNTSSDICPKGWYLPGHSAYNVDRRPSYRILIVSTYGILSGTEIDSATISQAAYDVAAPRLHAFPFSIPNTGYINGNTGQHFGPRGAYFHTQRLGGALTQGLMFRMCPDCATGSLPDISSGRGEPARAGLALRCLAK